MTMADEIAVMHDGRVEQRGRAVELYERPRTAFVARFLGTSNLISGTLSAGGRFTAASGERLQVPNGPVGAARAGVRPEKIQLLRSDAAPSDGAVNVISGQLTLASFLGTAIQYVIITSDGDELVVVEQNAGSIDPAPAIGSQVQVAWRPEHTFVVEEEPAPA